MKRFHLHVLSGLAGIVAMLGVTTSALAAITTAQLTAGSPTSNGPCPFTETFTGTISGQPFTTFQYSFNRFINGTQQVQNVGAARIPAGGSVAVSDSFSVSGTSAGVNFDQIWVHTIAGGQPDVYSARAPFFVNCITPNPGGPSGGSHVLTAGASGHSAVQLLYGVPTPFNLASTTDPHVCGQHGGLAGLFCIQAVPDRYLILIWDWQPNDKWPAIDGYHVYDVTNGGKTRVQDQTNPQATVEFFKPGSFVGKCYAVSAYKGANESPTSASFCAAGAQVGTNSRTVHMSNWGYFATSYTSCGFNAGICVVGTHCDDLCTGWTHSDSGANVTLDHENVYWRSYVQFEPSQIVGLNIAKATLQLRISGGDPTCFGAIGVAQAQAWGTDQAPNVTWADVMPAMNSKSAVFDVTSIVRDWASGAPNWGFALKGNNENNGAEDNGYCHLDYDLNGALSIQYY